MFFAMHREHLASAREELERVEQLTRELSVLQARLQTDESPNAGTTAVIGRDPKRLPHHNTKDRQTPAVSGNRTKRLVDANGCIQIGNQISQGKAAAKIRRWSELDGGATARPVDQTHHGTPARATRILAIHHEQNEQVMTILIPPRPPYAKRGRSVPRHFSHPFAAFVGEIIEISLSKL